MKQSGLPGAIKKDMKLRILYLTVVLSFIIPICFLIFRIIFNNVPENDEAYHSAADYSLMILQCFLGLLTINIPMILEKKFKFEVPILLYCFYIVFLYCAIFLGEVRNFYYVIPFWDTVLHCMSSMMTGFFAFMLVTILNRNENTVFSLSPFFVALFAFCFSLSIGALWEIYEYFFDGLLGLNMQKFITADGTVLEGHAALTDTMKDIVVDTAGAIISTAIGYISIKKDRKWIVPKITPAEISESTKMAD